MNQQSTFQTLAKSFKALLLASALYPLDRIQSVQQVKSTYSNSKLQKSQSIIGEAIHYGRKSYFRGFIPFIMKSSLLTTAAKVTDLTQNEQSTTEWSYIDSLSMGFGMLGYCVLYPLMSVEVEQQRFYSNVRECVSKIKRNQGIKTFYRGFFYSSTLFAAQLAAVKYGKKELEKEGKKYSEWQKIGILMGFAGASQLLFYPLLTMKKLFQINGAIGHIDNNFSIRRAAQFNNFSSLFRGLGTRISNLTIYALLYCFLLEQEQFL